MKRNVTILIFGFAAAVLTLLNIVYGVLFAVGLINFYGGGVFNAQTHLSLSITLIVFNALFVLLLAAYLIFRKVRK
jgi:ABC-type antimicrobial peptide transport system permease subunit